MGGCPPQSYLACKTGKLLHLGTFFHQFEAHLQVVDIVIDQLFHNVTPLCANWAIGGDAFFSNQGGHRTFNLGQTLREGIDLAQQPCKCHDYDWDDCFENVAPIHSSTPLDNYDSRTAVAAS